jgi:hypothetical protein
VRIGRPSSFADSGTLIRRLTADVQRPRERNKLPPASPPPDNPTAACTPANRFRSEPPNAATASCTTKPNAPDNAWPPSNAPRSAADLLRVLALELTCHPESTRPHAHSGDNLDADRQTVVVPPQRHVDRRLAIDVEPRRERHKLPPASSPRDNPTAACSRSNRFRVRTHPTRLLRTARPDRTRPTTPRHTPTLLGRPTAPDGSEGRETWVRLPRVREMKLTRGWSAPTVFGSGRGGP